MVFGHARDRIEVGIDGDPRILGIALALSDKPAHFPREIGVTRFQEWML